MVSRRETIDVPFTIRLRTSHGEQPHVDIANLGDDLQAVRQFARRWCGDDYPIEREAQARRFLRLRDRLCGAWRSGNRAYDNILDDYSPLVDVSKEGLRYFVDDIWTAIPILFFRDYGAGKTATCANPDCPNPYFIRRRKTQKYCEAGPCVAQAQREQKREWWKRNRGKGVKK